HEAPPAVGVELVVVAAERAHLERGGELAGGERLAAAVAAAEDTDAERLLLAPVGGGQVLLGPGHLEDLSLGQDGIFTSVRSGAILSVGSVFACTSLADTPGASSRSTRPSGVTSRTARSVMIRWTTALPVSGSAHSLSSLGAPFLAAWSMITTTRFARATRSIAPPMPLTILPGIIQFARSPFSDTSMAPRMARSMCPPRICPNESALEKTAEPGSMVTVSLPALMRSGSSFPATG